MDGQKQMVPRPWRPKDRKEQWFPESYCSQTANDSRENQAVIEGRGKKVIGWLEGDGGW